ncbi:SPASM domain-containing protein, partial [Brachyspira catarrhinii]
VSDRDLCGACVTSCCMDAKGNVYPCTGWNYDCGNLNETSLKDIWEKSPRMLYIRSLKRKDFNKCIDCKDIDYCFMCMAKNANESKTGNPLEINNHFCDVAHINRQVVENWREKNL